MLPDGVYPISNIKREVKTGNKLLNCGATLDYLFTVIEPRVSSADDGSIGLGEKIKKNKDLFSNYKDVLFANGVRNYFAHPGGRDKDYTEVEKERAAKYFIRAVKEACNHPAIPYQIRYEILDGSPQEQDSLSRAERAKTPKPKALSTPTDYQRSLGTTYERRRSVSKVSPRRLIRFIFLMIILATIYAGITRVGPLLTKLGSMFALPVHTEAAFVTASQLNLRAGPGSEFSIIAKLSRGDSVVCFEKRQSSDGGNWLRVRTGTFEGWVNQKLISKDRPSQQSPANIPPPTSANDAFANATFVEDFDDSSLGDAYGVSFVATPTGRGAAFNHNAESRVEYPAIRNFPTEGTLEWRILVQGGYSYSNGQLLLAKPEACVFTTTGPDTWYPGSTWLSVSHDGTITFAMADSMGGQTPLRVLTARNTTFRFGEWHTVGVSYGSEGRFIQVDGHSAAHDSLNLPLAVGGDLSHQIDMPTIGEMLSRFGWPNNKYDGGFDGIVDTFRVSSRQLDWQLSN